MRNKEQTKERTSGPTDMRVNNISLVDDKILGVPYTVIVFLNKM